MKSLHIVSFEEKHIESASILFAEQYKILRNKVGCLPKKYENGNSISSLLKNLVQKSLGVAAIENDKLIGYLIGMRLSYFKGNQQAIYCPEWAHAINSTNSPDIYRKLYERISMTWVERGCFTHVITLLLTDKEVTDSWFWNNFGLCTVDAIRELIPIEADEPKDIAIREANKNNID